MNLGDTASRFEAHTEIYGKAVGHTKIVLCEAKDVSVSVAADGIADVFCEPIWLPILKIRNGGKGERAAEIRIEEAVLLIAECICSELEGVTPARPRDSIAVLKYVFRAALRNDIGLAHGGETRNLNDRGKRRLQSGERLKDGLGAAKREPKLVDYR